MDELVDVGRDDSEDAEVRVPIYVDWLEPWCEVDKTCRDPTAA